MAGEISSRTALGHGRDRRHTLVSARIYIEGGESKEQKSRCREAFSKLLDNAGFKNKMPRLIASGSRNSAFDDFQTAVKTSGDRDFTALLIDSEDPVRDTEQPWTHLRNRDAWHKPPHVVDDQVFLMTTCMETWIVADRATLRAHYQEGFQENALPPLHELERRDRTELFTKLSAATRGCTNAYKKGARSFGIVGKLNPSALQSLTSFARMIRILKERL